MSKESVYMAYGGCLKKDHVKIGQTIDSEELRSRYKTYYGDDVKIKFIPVKNSKLVEGEIMEKLKEDYDSSGEIFKCSCKKAEDVIKDVTGKQRMKKC